MPTICNQLRAEDTHPWHLPQRLQAILTSPFSRLSSVMENTGHAAMHFLHFMHLSLIYFHSEKSGFIKERLKRAKRADQSALSSFLVSMGNVATVVAKIPMNSTAAKNVSISTICTNSVVVLKAHSHLQ